MRLTTKTNLAIRVLMFCAVNDGRVVRTADIAAHCNASINHLLHVVGLLQDFGAVETIRGRAGGLQLARHAGQISLGQVFRRLESGTPFVECFDPATNTCPLIGDCRLRGYLARATEAFYHELDLLTLDDLVKGNCGLAKLLELAPVAPPACSPAGKVSPPV